jgi:hypothetical protein
LINKGLLDAIFVNDKVQTPEIEEKTETRPDLAFLKRWIVQQDVETNVPVIKLEVKITNISEEILSKINLFLGLPRGILIQPKNEAKNVRSIQTLSPAEEAIISWTFWKKSDIFTQASAAILKLIITFQKGGGISSLTKKLDILLL